MAAGAAADDDGPGPPPSPSLSQSSSHAPGPAAAAHSVSFAAEHGGEDDAPPPHHSAVGVEEIRVELVRAAGFESLPRHSISHRSPNLRARVVVDGGEVLATRVRKRTYTPEWGESVILVVPAGDEPPEAEVRVYTVRTFPARDREVAHGSVSLSPLAGERWVPVRARGSDEEIGRVCVRLSDASGGGVRPRIVQAVGGVEEDAACDAGADGADVADGALNGAAAQLTAWAQLKWREACASGWWPWPRSMAGVDGSPLTLRQLQARHELGLKVAFCSVATAAALLLRCVHWQLFVFLLAGLNGACVYYVVHRKSIRNAMMKRSAKRRIMWVGSRFRKSKPKKERKGRRDDKESEGKSS